MNDKKKFFIIILVFAVLIAGALVLYNNLGKNVDTQNMVVHETQQPTAEPAENASDSQEAAATETAQAEPDATAEVNLAKDAHVYDREGNAVHLSQFFGKPMVLNFWASWCAPCQSEMPDFNEKFKEHGGEVNFVMVNMTDGVRDTVEKASAFIDKNGFEFPVFYDTSSEAIKAYGAYSLPTTYFINAQGHIVAEAVGALDAETLQQGIDLIKN